MGLRPVGSCAQVHRKVLKVIPPLADPYVTDLLERITDGKHAMNVAVGETVFAQGDPADAIFFIESGKVKMSVVSAAGKEAVLVVLGPRNFLGEGSLVGQSLRRDLPLERNC